MSWGGTIDGDLGGRLFTIAPGLPFVDALAAGILARVGDDPLALSRLTVLLPTVRAVRALREAFLRLSDGTPILLPRLSPLGDVDTDEVVFTQGGTDLPQAVPALRRQLLLARLVMRAPDLAATPAQAVSLAGELARLLDEVQTEGCRFEDLARLVPDDYAQHWQVTLRFLEIITQHWPALLADEGGVDPAQERELRLKALADTWRAKPPPGPVIAAGSTGSIPATADLLAVVAALPQGAVVLPGLDLGCDEATWQDLDEAHPQYGLKRLLHRLDIPRSEVRPWPLPDPLPEPLAARRRSHPARARLIAEALRPAGTTEAWQDLSASPLAAEADAALAGLTRLDAATPQEEAGAIALMMREVLETPGRTAALVTADRDLARRVALALKRWDIAVNDSAGLPLTQSAVGSYLRLLADWAAEPSPLALLSLLKHPLAAGGHNPSFFRAQVRDLERAVLRGPRPADGFDGLRLALTQADARRFDAHGDVDAHRARLGTFIDGLEDILRPLLAAMNGAGRTLAGWLDLHARTAEALAASDEQSGAERLWRLDDGEAAASFVDEVQDAGHDFPELGGPDYAAVISALMVGRAVRPRYGLHPRLYILGLLEARLQQFDVMILGGLNEGTWPPQPKADPWLSRPMRQRFGLPTPEQHLGQTAHDFAQACGAPVVVLTRSERVEGTPTVPSRWLLRLDTVLKALGRARSLSGGMGRWTAWTEAMDTPAAVRPCPPPEPRPPVAARPRRLSVTQVETWMRDPYALYARHVLRLEALDPLDADPGAADRGTMIHKALDDFIKANPGTLLPEDARDQLLRFGRLAFAPYSGLPSLETFWWPRFERIADWFLALERDRRAGGVQPLATEAKGILTVEAASKPFEIIAKADRIDRHPDGSVAIIDYKTGTPPRARDVELGFAPQLPLEAAIALAGGFGLRVPVVEQLAFWRLTGGEPAGQVVALKLDPARLAAEAVEGLRQLIDLFDQESTPYRSQPRPGMAPRYSDYLHLARVAEWSVGDGGEA
ncbi:double-strand break repair protein AddB [Nitrospirillum sp. BR 11828]|uniref:double-strand break repair protein AddB n=1 Tax=Nitrospirillum sp. BR 11828 TaxID=3104325 RepID=UPI002ACA1560|nr:double-strand break repair protein AddB [Nitrospirillum sp. BR 11828]MDZ5646865.1 double-strand break repair protein AddB [Nitrospirillum sp. BR 11828]